MNEQVAQENLSYRLPTWHIGLRRTLPPATSSPRFVRWLGSCLRIAWFGLSFSAVPLSACSNAGDIGTLDVTWTINSTSDATLCDKSVGWVVVQVTDSSGNRYSSSNGPCNSFSTVFTSIPSGDYSVNAYMFNASNNATLSTVGAHTVGVKSGLTTIDSINFSVAGSN